MAVFKENEEDLLKQQNSIHIFNKLRTMAQRTSNAAKLTQVMYACIRAVNVAPQIAFYDPMMRNFSKKNFKFLFFF